MKRLIIYALLTTGLLFIDRNSYSQNAIAVSSNPGPGLHIALNWAPVKNAARYQIYRRKETDAAYPITPLNPTPVQMMTNCTTIKSTLIVAFDSTHWKLLTKGLADSTKLYNPCNINLLSWGSEKYKRLQSIAKASMPVAIVCGWGYQDKTAVNGTTYYYKIVAVTAIGSILSTIATDLKVTAGTFAALPAPTGISAEAGDDRIMVMWNKSEGAAGYQLERSLSAAGPFVRVNDSRYTLEIRNHLNGDTLIPSANGMNDFQRYKLSNGKDSTHLVNGVAIDGPKNGTSYYYRVSAIDLFERPGTPSAVTGPHTPVDVTPPSIPMDIEAVADNTNGWVTVSWTQVVRNSDGHWERPDSAVRYNLYRFTGSGNPGLIPGVLVAANISTIKGLYARDTVDKDPALRSIYGNKTWWYRLKAVDPNGNTSQWSVARSATIKDITAPSIPKNLATKGLEKEIELNWSANPEPDISGYRIYRSLCHLGSWVECKSQDTCSTWQRYNPYGESKTPSSTSPTTGAGLKGTPCPCSGAFVFLGEITKDSVKRASDRGRPYFIDKTIPAGSPLCYAYWIKAIDSSDNQSGQFPLPAPAEVMEIKCERLRDRTPPEKAIIAGLFAQADRIKVEWVGPPTQDTRAYHVYRAAGTDPAKEPKNAEYVWVGGMTVELPPIPPQVLTEPYKAPALATCDKIAVQGTSWMSSGFYEDKGIVPRRTYWYKVVGIDYDGNETRLDSAAAISTFSFTSKLAEAPEITLIDNQLSPCGVKMKWSPPYNSDRHLGFIVYRSDQESGPFHPIVTAPVKGNEFTDEKVIKGRDYHYRVAALMRNGRLSKPSAVKKIIP